VPGKGGRPIGPGQGPLLALWSLAAVQLGELEAASAAELPSLWRAVLLVAQPQEHRLRQLRAANDEGTNLTAKGAVKQAKKVRIEGDEQRLGTKPAPNQERKTGFCSISRQACAVFTIPLSHWPARMKPPRQGTRG
jgi:hypothetical protein